MEPMGCLCFGSLQCALGVRSIVCAWCVQHFLCVASLTEMESMGCLCFGILQCALGVRSIFRFPYVASLTEMEPMGVCATEFCSVR
jgi:hypothetical protein